jgi:hypothetical protein
LEPRLVQDHGPHDLGGTVLGEPGFDPGDEFGYFVVVGAAERARRPTSSAPQLLPGYKG